MYEFNVNGVVDMVGLMVPTDSWKLLSERLNTILWLLDFVFWNLKSLDNRVDKLSQLLILLPTILPLPDWLVPMKSFMRIREATIALNEIQINNNNYHRSKSLDTYIKPWATHAVGRFGSFKTIGGAISS